MACLVAAGASWLRGGKYHYTDEDFQPIPAVAPAQAPVSGENGHPRPATGQAMTLVAISASYGAGGTVIGPELAAAWG